MDLYDFNVYNVILRNARCFKNRKAWIEVSDGRECTFGEFKDLVDRLAKGLQDAGVKKGHRIGIIGKNSLEYFLVYGASSALGAIVVPINWRLSGEEIKANLEDGSPRLIFADSDFQELIQENQASLKHVQRFFSLNGDNRELDDFNQLLENDGDFQPGEISSRDRIIMIHTAAVGGKPRGALLSHGNIVSVTTQFCYAFRLYKEDVHLNVLPLFHVGGISSAFSTFHAGALNINMSKFDAQQALDIINERGVSFMFDFAPILGSILDQQEKTGKVIHSLRAVAGLDNPQTIERYQEIAGGDFFSVYGQTEVTALVTVCPYSERPGSAGRPLPLTDIRIFDDYDREVETGNTGEIVVRGPTVFQGYWNLPADTEYTFRGGWHHTGDIGRFDEMGFLWYAGRKSEKELIKPGGENVYPLEVEKVILQHPAVERTVVIGVPDPKWKEGIKAVCQLKEGEALDASELIDFVGQRIARYKKPQYVELVDSLPLLDDRNPDRAKVKEIYGKSGQ